MQLTPRITAHVATTSVILPMHFMNFLPLLFLLKTKGRRRAFQYVVGYGLQVFAILPLDVTTGNCQK